MNRTPVGGSRRPVMALLKVIFAISAAIENQQLLHQENPGRASPVVEV